MECILCFGPGNGLDSSRGGQSGATGRHKIDKHRSLVAEYLSAHVIALATVAAEIDRRYRAPTEFEHGNEVVDIANLAQREINQRKIMSRDPLDI